eukprot:jgi/Orpsp1_1/1174329/evm.model.c7180000049702.1
MIAISSSEDLASNSFSNTSLPSSLKQSQIQQFFKPTSHSNSNSNLPSSSSYSTYSSSNSNSNEFIKPPPVSKLHGLNHKHSSAFSITSPLARTSSTLNMDIDKTMNMNIDDGIEPLDNLNHYNPMYQPNQSNENILSNPFDPANLNLLSENHQPKDDTYSESSYNPTIHGDNPPPPPAPHPTDNLFPNSLAYEKANHYRSQTYPVPGPTSGYVEGDSMISDTSTITSTMIKKQSSPPQLQNQTQSQHLPGSSSTLHRNMDLPLPRVNSINDFIHHQELRRPQQQHSHQLNQPNQPNQSQPSPGGMSHTPTSPYSAINKNTPGLLEGDYISIEDVQALASHSIPHKMLLTALENSVEKIRDDFQEDMTNMHLEIIRQFHIQK